MIGKSKWDDDSDPDEKERVRLQKEERLSKKRLRLEKKRKENEATQQQQQQQQQQQHQQNNLEENREDIGKKQKIESESIDNEDEVAVVEEPVKLLRMHAMDIAECRNVDRFERLNHIEEGSYGVVSRARDTETGEIVALKRLKLNKEKNGFPVTSLREIRTLMGARHPHVVNIREVVMGDEIDQVYIVMDFIEHDLKTLMENMREPFLQSEVKTLVLQLLSAVSTLHRNWIVHRDLKTSNLLMTNNGMIKIADFGLARFFSDPLPEMTGLVVTLWYRSPELLLGTEEYSTAVDLWSIGCILAELLSREPLFQGRSEIDQLIKIFDLLGVPNEKTWPGFSELPNSKKLRFPKETKT